MIIVNNSGFIQTSQEENKKSGNANNSRLNSNLNNSQQTSIKGEAINNAKEGPNKYIELMINIYLLEEELKNKIIRKLENTNEENYIIISKKWMEKLKERQHSKK